MKDDFKYLSHVLESINNIEKFVERVTQKEFLKDVEKQYAVIRGLEIIGEAVKNLSSSFREKYPFVTWRDIAGTRDILIHAYFEIDLNIIWDVVKEDLPILKKQIQEILKKEEKD